MADDRAGANSITPSKNKVVILVLGILSLIFALTFTLTWQDGGLHFIAGFPLDDAWIHLVYAQNVADFHGFAYNPGDLQTGFTSPGWVLLLAPLFFLQKLLPFDIDIGVKTLGWLLMWTSGVLAYRLSALISASSKIGLLAAFLVLADPHTGFSAVSGMEVILAGTLILAFSDQIWRRQWLAAAMFAAMLPLARPTLAVFTVIFLLGLTLLRLQKKVGTKTWLLGLIPSGISGGGWLLFNYLVSTKWLPATYYAKHLRGTGIDWINLERFVALFADLSFVSYGVGLLALAWGTAYWMGQGRHRLMMILVLPLVFFATASQVMPVIQPWAYYWHRYGEPIVPLLNMLIGLGLGGCILWLKGIKGNLKYLGGAMMVAGLVFVGYRTVLKNTELYERYAQNVRNINEVQVESAHWISKNLPVDAVVAGNDAGALRFFGGRKILDIVGLNEYRIFTLTPAETIRIYNPQYYLVHLHWLNTLFPPETYDLIKTFKTENYTICDCAAQDTLYLVSAKKDSPQNSTLHQP